MKTLFSRSNKPTQRELASEFYNSNGQVESVRKEEKSDRYAYQNYFYNTNGKLDSVKGEHKIDSIFHSTTFISYSYNSDGKLHERVAFFRGQKSGSREYEYKGKKVSAIKLYNKKDQLITNQKYVLNNKGYISSFEKRHSHSSHKRIEIYTYNKDNFIVYKEVKDPYINQYYYVKYIRDKNNRLIEIRNYRKNEKLVSLEKFTYENDLLVKKVKTYTYDKFQEVEVYKYTFFEN